MFPHLFYKHWVTALYQLKVKRDVVLKRGMGCRRQEGRGVGSASRRGQKPVKGCEHHSLALTVPHCCSVKFILTKPAQLAAGSPHGAVRTHPGEAQGLDRMIPTQQDREATGSCTPDSCSESLDAQATLDSLFTPVLWKSSTLESRAPGSVKVRGSSGHLVKP